MTDTNIHPHPLNETTLAMAATFLNLLGEPGHYHCELGVLRQLIEATQQQLVDEKPETTGLYAVRHIYNWDGEGDVMTSLATYDKDGKWRYHENGATLLEYQGDRILKAWPLDHAGGQVLTYSAGLSAAVKTIRSLMDEFREEHSEREPEPGTSGMSEKDLAIWHGMYRLERAVREMKNENPVPQPAVAADLKQARRDFEIWYLQAHGVHNVFGDAISEREMLARFNPTRRTDPKWIYSMEMLWKQWLKCQDSAHQMHLMDTAPRDGTRFLARCITYGYDTTHGDHIAIGEQWNECWYRDGAFVHWRGNEQISTTAYLDPVGWIQLPGSAQCPQAQDWFNQEEDNG